MVPSSFFCKNSIRCKRYTWPSYVGSAYLNYQALFPWHIDIHKNQSTEYVWIWASEASASMLGTGSNCFLDMKMKGETQLCWLQATAHPPPPPPPRRTPHPPHQVFPRYSIFVHLILETNMPILFPTCNMPMHIGGNQDYLNDIFVEIFLALCFSCKIYFSLLERLLMAFKIDGFRMSNSVNIHT